MMCFVTFAVMGGTGQMVRPVWGRRSRGATVGLVWGVGTLRVVLWQAALLGSVLRAVGLVRLLVVVQLDSVLAPAALWEQLSVVVLRSVWVHWPVVLLWSVWVHWQAVLLESVSQHSPAVLLLRPVWVHWLVVLL